MGTAITYGPLQHGRGIQRHCNTASDTYCDTAGWLVRRKSRRGLGESPERPAKGFPLPDLLDGIRQRVNAGHAGGAATC
jgi:hypothetical protein